MIPSGQHHTWRIVRGRRRNLLGPVVCWRGAGRFALIETVVGPVWVVSTDIQRVPLWKIMSVIRSLRRHVGRSRAATTRPWTAARSPRRHFRQRVQPTQPGQPVAVTEKTRRRPGPRSEAAVSPLWGELAAAQALTPVPTAAEQTAALRERIRARLRATA